MASKLQKWQLTYRSPFKNCSQQAYPDVQKCRTALTTCFCGFSHPPAILADVAYTSLHFLHYSHLQFQFHIFSHSFTTSKLRCPIHAACTCIYRKCDVTLSEYFSKHLWRVKEQVNSDSLLILTNFLWNRVEFNDLKDSHLLMNDIIYHRSSISSCTSLPNHYITTLLPPYPNACNSSALQSWRMGFNIGLWCFRVQSKTGKWKVIALSSCNTHLRLEWCVWNVSFDERSSAVETSKSQQAFRSNILLSSPVPTRCVCIYIWQYIKQ